MQDITGKGWYGICDYLLQLWSVALEFLLVIDCYDVWIRVVDPQRYRVNQCRNDAKVIGPVGNDTVQFFTRQRIADRKWNYVRIRLVKDAGDRLVVVPCVVKLRIFGKELKFMRKEDRRIDKPIESMKDLDLCHDVVTLLHCIFSK